jgi:hypothetical protein
MASGAKLTMLSYLRRAFGPLRRNPPSPPRVKPSPSSVKQKFGFDYLSLVARCKSQNDFNQLHIKLENICTPLEIAQFAELARASSLPKQSLDWFEKLRRLAPDLFSAPHPYRRRTYSKFVLRYRSGNLKPSQKMLLIGFAGYAERLMMPIAVFLQFVDPDKWDVLLLKRTFEQLDDLPGLVQHIKATFCPESYQRVIAYGTSGGGFSAICAALLMQVDRGICIGGFPPGPLPPVSDADRAAAHPDLWFVYGSDFPKDYERALALQDRFGGRLRAMPGVDSHHILGKVLERGEFAQFLEEMLV